MPSERRPFSYLISCDSPDEVDAVEFLRARWAGPVWWRETIITELDYIGEIHEVSVLENLRMFEKQIKVGGK